MSEAELQESAIVLTTVLYHAAISAMRRGGLCVHLAAALIAGGSLAGVAHAQDPFGKQTYPATIRIAEHLASVQPATAWELATEGEAADLIEFITNDRVLVGVMDVDKNAVPSYGKVYLIDASTGTKLWDYERDGSTGSYSLIATSPVLLLMRAGPESIDLTALDNESGKKVWDLEAGAPYGVAMAIDRQLLLVVYRDGNDQKMRGVDLGSGDRRWELDLNADAFAPSTPVSVHVDGRFAFVFGQAIVEIDIEAEAVVRTMNAPELASGSGSAVLLGDGVLAWNAESVTYFDRATGAPRWTDSYQTGANQAVAVVGDGIARLSGLDNPMMSLLNSVDGSGRWFVDLAGRVVSPIASEGDLLVVTTDSTIVGISVSGGTTAFVTALPDTMAVGSPSFAEAMGIPDVLHTAGGVVFVARDGAGLAAFDLSSGELLRYEPHYEAALAPINYTADGRFAFLYTTLIEMGRIEPGGAINPPPSLANITRSSSSSMLANAQRNYDTARARYERTASDPNATIGDRRAAGGRVRLASELALTATELDIAAGRLNAGVALANSLVGLHNAIMEMHRASGRQGAIDRVQFAMQGALRVQQRLFQDKYYLRPFYLAGWGRGVTIIDTDSGGRRDVIFSPHNPPSIGYGLDMPTFTVSPDGQRLVVFGISLDTDSYERRNKWSTHVPNYSILGYEFGAIELVDHPTVYPSIIAAALAGDSTQLDWLLDRGDVNERSPVTEDTPLSTAAMIGNAALAERFLDLGADVNAKNAAGMTAIDVAILQDVYDVLVEAGGVSGLTGEVPPPPNFIPPPLAMAVMIDQPDRIRELAADGADVDWRNNDGETPLFYAVVLEKGHLVELLLELGADVNAVDNKGQTPLDVARTDEIREILRAAGGKSGG